MQGRKLSLKDKKNSWKEAVENYKKARDYWQEAGDRSEEAKTLYSIAMVCSKFEPPEVAVDYLNPALLIQREILDRRGEGFTLNELGLAYGHFEPKKAVECLL